MNSDAGRHQANSSWAAKALAYTLASALAGAATGMLLGAIGASLAVELRLAAASLLAVVGIILGGLELGGWRARPLQCDRETPQRWLHAGALRWALRNGWTLGVGATSRIGFWLWYVVPITALLGGHPLLGMLVYGTYGLTRGGAAWPLLLATARSTGRSPVAVWLLDAAPVARALAAGQLLLIGLAVTIVLGI